MILLVYVDDTDRVTNLNPEPEIHAQTQDSKTENPNLRPSSTRTRPEQTTPSLSPFTLVLVESRCDVPETRASMTPTCVDQRRRGLSVGDAHARLEDHTRAKHSRAQHACCQRKERYQHQTLRFQPRPPMLALSCLRF